MLELGDQGRITAEVERASCSIRVEREGDGVRFHISVDVRAEIADETKPQKMMRENLDHINTALSERIEADIRRAIDQSVLRSGCDVIGLERLMMQQEPELVKGSEDRWPAGLKDCSYEIEVKAVVDKFGEEAEH